MHFKFIPQCFVLQVHVLIRQALNATDVITCACFRNVAISVFGKAHAIGILLGSLLLPVVCLSPHREGCGGGAMISLGGSIAE